MITFEVHYERRLLAVAYNRVDQYILLRYKGVGANNVDQNESKSQRTIRTQLRVEHEILNTRWILKRGPVHAVLGELVNPVGNHVSINMLLLTKTI